MSGMPAYALIAAALAFAGSFLALQPRNKVLVAFLVLSSLFDLVPSIVFGFASRDPGFVLMMIAWAHLLLRRRVTRVPPTLTVTAIQGMVAWALLCVLYGVFVDGYPLLLTLKASRQWILGYATFFVFLRLYETDPGAFAHLTRWLYRITFVLMPVVIIQYMINVPIFFGLVREYAGAVRALPIFLPILWLFSWHILCRLFAGQRVRADEQAYALLAAIVTALTYTRGIYLAAIATILLLLITLRGSGRLRVSRALGMGLGAVACLSVLLVTGTMERVVNRFVSGVSVIRGVESTGRSYSDDVDTFTGRLLVVGERFGVVAGSNPVFGFAFIHENLVPGSLRAELRYGGPIDTPEYAKLYAQGMPYVMSLHQVDIGWADIVTDMGFPALLLTLAAIAGVVSRQVVVVNARRTSSEDYFWSTAMFLQICMLVLLMFNGNPYVQNVHMACFMLASFSLCSRVVTVERRAMADIRQVLRF